MYLCIDLLCIFVYIFYVHLCINLCIFVYYINIQRRCTYTMYISAIYIYQLSMVLCSHILCIKLICIYLYLYPPYMYIFLYASPMYICIHLLCISFYPSSLYLCILCIYVSNPNSAGIQTRVFWCKPILDIADDQRLVVG